MIYAGTDLKFKVTTTYTGFYLTENRFTITVTDAFGRIIVKKTNGDCFYDSDGNCYFLIENPLTGKYYASFAGSVSDEDYIKGERVFTDRQHLIDVGLCSCTSAPSCGCGTHYVKYEQVWTVDIDGAEYLADKDGNYIYTSDGKRIQFTNNINKNNDDMAKVQLNMTGDEFKKLIEGNEPNSEVNTIPEVMRVMQGISDDTTVKQEIKDESGTTYDEGNEKLYLNGAKPKEE